MASFSSAAFSTDAFSVLAFDFDDGEEASNAYRRMAQAIATRMHRRAVKGWQTRRATREEEAQIERMRQALIEAEEEELLMFLLNLD